MIPSTRCDQEVFPLLDTEYHETEFFDIERGVWCFVCTWRRPGELAEEVHLHFCANPEDGEREFLREKSWETYGRHLRQVKSGLRRRTGGKN